MSIPLASPRGADAQGISTGTIRGTVRTEAGAIVDGALVQVRNVATGFSVGTRATGGRFFTHGLDVGGPYVVEVRQVGFVAQRSRPLHVTLGQPLEVAFVLRAGVTQLGAVEVTARASEALVHAGGGTATVITDSLLQRLPTLSRNFIDFVQLDPHVSTKIGSQRSGMSAAGANLRFNNYLINGVEERFVSGSVSAANSGKSIPIDAVKEYQVLVAPYDVRYGDFAGALVNTVTQSGTNQLHGSTFAYWRNDRLARHGEGALDGQRYERWQYGLSLGGPIIRDRVHFFVAPEIQRLTSPAPGPYLGQPAAATPRVPVREADVARFAAIMRDAHGLAAGSGSAVERESPLRNLFARLDATVPRWRSRAIGLVTYASVHEDEFSRAAPDTFFLSSTRQITAGQLLLSSLQLHTDLARLGGGHNELLVSRSADRSQQLAAVRQPLVQVLVPASTGAGNVSLVAGTPASAQASGRTAEAIRIKDELTLPLGARHVVVLGVQGERFQVHPGGVANGYGTWTFRSLDSLERGVADQYRLQQDLGSAGTVLRGGQYAAYAGDEWRAGERLSVTLGLRADILALGGHAPYNAEVDSLFGRRTDEMPRPRVHLSPRAGFTWKLSDAGRDEIRGGAGIFTGRPPLAWLRPALANHGVGIGSLSCGSSARDSGPPPPFEPDFRNPPTSCTGGEGPALPRGDVDLLDRNLRMAQALRASLAYDRRLPWDLVASTELLVTRYLSDFMFVNLNLAGPQAVDRFGRVMYGAIDTTGRVAANRRSPFPGVIDLRNTSANRSTQLSTRVERRIVHGIGTTVSYTYSRTRDVQSPSRVNSSGTMIWADARAVSGRHEDESVGVSLNDLPHRVVAALTYATPSSRWATGFSFYYVGESGSPFTYRAVGDLNADGSGANDPIYVPRSAYDTSEIRFSGTAQQVVEQQAAFERFVGSRSCLTAQRGRIMARNSCREPWTHTTIASLRQAVSVGGRTLETQLDVFNVLDLLNVDGGRYRVAEPRVLTLVRQTPGPPETAQSVFRFDPVRAGWRTLATESAFQLQLAVRWRF